MVKIMQNNLIDSIFMPPPPLFLIITVFQTITCHLIRGFSWHLIMVDLRLDLESIVKIHNSSFVCRFSWFRKMGSKPFSIHTYILTNTISEICSKNILSNWNRNPKTINFTRQIMIYLKIILAPLCTISEFVTAYPPDMCKRAVTNWNAQLSKKIYIFRADILSDFLCKLFIWKKSLYKKNPT